MTSRLIISGNHELVHVMRLRNSNDGVDLKDFRNTVARMQEQLQ